jgi:hypothetical protein
MYLIARAHLHARPPNVREAARLHALGAGGGVADASLALSEMLLA